VIASRPYGYEEWQFPFQEHRLGEVRLAPLSHLQSASFVEGWFAAGARKEAAKRLLERGPSVQTMAQNPFLLTLMCAVEEREELPEDVTRTELYKRVIDRLLGSPKRAAVSMPMLEELNWLAFERSPRQPRLEAGELLDLLQKSDNQPPTKREKSGTRRAVVKLHDELARKRLLVPFDQAEKYCWPHRSIAEYLAAGSLGLRLLDGAGWDLIDEKSWDPACGQVILFLGNVSEQQTALKRLIDKLADEKTDDLIHCRLVLAAKSLAELPEKALSHLGDGATAIIEIAYSWWDEMHSPGGKSAFPVVAQVDMKTGGR
jgi:hypothetical protein